MGEVKQEVEVHEAELCEGCNKPLREDEGHETEDMVVLCDGCWGECQKDRDCHSDECVCALCCTALRGERDAARQRVVLLEGALKRIVGDFECDYVLDSVVVDEPYVTHRQAWLIARAALCQPAPAPEKERQ